MDMKTKPKVLRVTATEFELSDGRIYPHPVPLDNVPTPEEFQDIYDYWRDIIEQVLTGRTGNAQKSR
jgi:hypothetical protein